MPSYQPGLEWFSTHLIEMLPAAVYVCDMDAVVVAFNRRAVELWGRTPTVGQTDEKFCGAHKLYWPDGTFLPHHETPMAWVLRTGQPSSDQETVIERPDGSRVTVLVNIAPIFDESGNQTGAVNCFQDLTAQKRSETERITLRDALRQSQKMEAVGQLTGGLAHDFNNLLASISGNLELMRLRVADGKTDYLTRYITAAHEASQRAAAVTHRLLAFSRKQALEVRTVNINRLVGDMKELIRRTAGPAITVEFDQCAELWNAAIDPNQFENALLNLCLNARDAMPDGGKLTVAITNETFDATTALIQDIRPGHYVSLSIRDTGVGMSPDHVGRAFEPFFTTKPIGTGTGLGLSMVYGFARVCGGQVRIYSEIDQGTQVCLYLPRKIGREDALDTPPDLVAPEYVGSGGTVLIVDDEAAMRLLVTEVLEDQGYVTLNAADAHAGLRILLSSTSIDLLITDIGLPGGMDGQQFAQLAREGRPNLKVLFITGYADATVLDHQDLPAGMHLMTKPFALSAFVDRVSALFAEP